MPEPRITSFVPGTITGTRTAASESSHSAGHAAGYAAGYAAGARAAANAAAVQTERDKADHERREAERDQHIAQAVQALNAAIQQWRALAAPVLADSEDLLHQGAIEIAQAILTRELKPGPETAMNVLQRALDVPASVIPTAIRVSEADLEHIHQALADGAAALPDGVNLTADPHLGPGDAVTEHAYGVLDARISAGITRARAALEETP